MLTRGGVGGWVDKVWTRTEGREWEGNKSRHWYQLQGCRFVVAFKCWTPRNGMAFLYRSMVLVALYHFCLRCVLNELIKSRLSDFDQGRSGRRSTKPQHSQRNQASPLRKCHFVCVQGFVVQMHIESSTNISTNGRYAYIRSTIGYLCQCTWRHTLND